MHKALRTLWVFLGFFGALDQVQASADSFALDVHQLKVIGCNRAIDMEPLERKWKSSFDSLMQATENRGVAEEQLSNCMEELVNLLMYNYNLTGLELLKAYAPPRTLLRLANAYFDNQNQFSANNKPPLGTDLKKTAFEIYHLVWNLSKGVQVKCLQEFSEIRSTGCFADLRFHCLPDSQAELIMANMKKRMAWFMDYDPEGSAILDLKLLDIREDTLSAFGLNLLYSIDPFLPPEMQQFAWCANNVMGQAAFCVELYNYEKGKQAFYKPGEFSNFKDWLQAVNPKPKLLENSTELSKSVDSAMILDPVH